MSQPVALAVDARAELWEIVRLADLAQGWLEHPSGPSFPEMIGAALQSIRCRASEIANDLEDSEYIRTAGHALALVR